MNTENFLTMGRRPKTERTNNGQQLLELRLKARLSQEQVAAELGVHQTTYAEWEINGMLPGRAIIPKLMTLYKATLEEVTGEKPSNGTHRGPVGKLEKLFQHISELPPRRQKVFMDFVQDWLRKEP